MDESVPTERRALVVVDVQRDFCPGGSLAVTDGDVVAARIARFLGDHAGDYTAVVATRDWHVDPGSHFAPPGVEPDFRTSWPRHCVAGSEGAAYHPALGAALAQIVDAEFRKGADRAAYSGFEGSVAGDPDLDLGTWLALRDVRAVDVVGIATDHCVRATAADALTRGLAVRVLVDLCAGVDAEASTAALAELTAAGATVATTDGTS